MRSHLRYSPLHGPGSSGCSHTSNSCWSTLPWLEVMIRLLRIEFRPLFSSDSIPETRLLAFSFRLEPVPVAQAPAVVEGHALLPLAVKVPRLHQASGKSKQKFNNVLFIFLNITFKQNRLFTQYHTNRF